MSELPCYTMSPFFPHTRVGTRHNQNLKRIPGDSGHLIMALGMSAGLSRAMGWLFGDFLACIVCAVDLKSWDHLDGKRLCLCKHGFYVCTNSWMLTLIEYIQCAAFGNENFHSVQPLEVRTCIGSLDCLTGQKHVFREGLKRTWETGIPHPPEPQPGWPGSAAAYVADNNNNNNKKRCYFLCTKFGSVKA